MSDIVERLRNAARNYADGRAGMEPADHFCWEAADEIERLRTELSNIHEHAIMGQDDAADGFLKIAGMVRDALARKP